MKAKKTRNSSSAWMPYVVSLPPEQLNWIRTTSKEMKLKATVLVRSIIAQAQLSDIQSLRGTLMRSRLEAELQEAEKAAEKALERKTLAEKELAKLNA